MLEKHVLSDEAIVTFLHTHYGIAAATLTFLPIGADTNASVYKAQTFDHISYFVKLKRGHHHDIGAEITELLKRAGVQQIIPPIKTIDGRVTQPIDEYSLIVYPFIEGIDGFSRSLTENQWIQLGKALKQVHQIDLPESIQNRIRRETYSSKWRHALLSILAQMETDPETDEIGNKLHTFMKKVLPELHELVDRAETLGEALKKNSPEFVLCHSDIHGGNVLIHETSDIYIVDWDEPIMAPKERDLMFIGGGVGNVWNKSFEETLFYSGYGKTEVTVTSLAYYRLERIVEDIAIYSHELLLSTNGGVNRNEMYTHFIAMFEPQGVVEIARNTYESL